MGGGQELVHDACERKIEPVGGASGGAGGGGGAGTGFVGAGAGDAGHDTTD